MNYHNLLVDRVLPVNGDECLSLPEVLASLAQGDHIQSFPGLQPHQWPAWYQFLVQIAALSTLDRAEEWHTYDASAWQAALRSLTPHPGDEPWCLVVGDLAKPALLQPPVPEGTLEEFEGPLRSPAERNLDVLVTTRHHDLKGDRIVSPYPYHWIFSLVFLQTQAGYSGLNFKYGIVRMNGGFGNRPLVGLVPGRGWGERFRRDLSVLLREHPNLTQEHQRPRRGGIALGWLDSWDGETQLRLSDCDPYHVEVCRRVRLTNEDDKVFAYRRDTRVPRVLPKSDVLKGNMGDPWIPVNTSKNAALGVGYTGFSYDLTRQLLIQDGFKGGVCQQIQPDDADPLWLCCAALARGDGGTEGFHERWVPIPARARSFLLNPDKKRTLGELARERVSRAGNVWDRALFPALQALLSGGRRAETESKQKKARSQKMPERWKRMYEQGVDQRYFPQLWSDLELDTIEQQRRWAEVLRDLARSILHQAEREAPIPDARRERASAAAWGLLEAGMRKQIPEVFADNTPTRDAEEDLDADPTLP